MNDDKLSVIFFAIVSGSNSKIRIFLNFFVGKNNVYLSGKKICFPLFLFAAPTVYVLFLFSILNKLLHLESRIRIMQQSHAPLMLNYSKLKQLRSNVLAVYQIIIKMFFLPFWTCKNIWEKRAIIAILPINYKKRECLKTHKIRMETIFIWKYCLRKENMSNELCQVEMK